MELKKMGIKLNFSEKTSLFFVLFLNRSLSKFTFSLTLALTFCNVENSLKPA